MTKAATLSKDLENRIRSGSWRRGQSLPSRSRLSGEYDVSPGTVSNVMRSLRQKGLVRIVPGKGVYVAADGDSDHTRGQARAGAKRLVGLAGSSVSADLANYGTDQVFTRPILDGVWAAAQKKQCPLVLLPASPGSSGFDANHCQSIGVEGLVLIGSGYYEEAAALRRQGIPVVMSNQPAEPTPLSFVDYDNADSIRRAVGRFVEAGHHRIAAVGVCSDPGYFDAMKLRFVEALLNHQLIYDYNGCWAFVRRGDDGAQPGKAQIEAEVERLLALPEPPTAIYCWTPLSLAATRGVLERHGLRVPEDISLMCGGFASEEEAMVSGFVVPHMQLGEALVDHLLEAIEDPSASRQELMPATLVDRGTVRRA